MSYTKINIEMSESLKVYFGLLRKEYNSYHFHDTNTLPIDHRTEKNIRLNIKANSIMIKKGKTPLPSLQTKKSKSFLLNPYHGTTIRVEKNGNITTGTITVKSRKIKFNIISDIKSGIYTDSTVNMIDNVPFLYINLKNRRSLCRSISKSDFERRKTKVIKDNIKELSRRLKYIDLKVHTKSYTHTDKLQQQHNAKVQFKINLYNLLYDLNKEFKNMNFKRFTESSRLPSIFGKENQFVNFGGLTSFTETQLNELNTVLAKEYFTVAAFMENGNRKIELLDRIISL